jgi:hypothetical protein
LSTRHLCSSTSTDQIHLIAVWELAFSWLTSRISEYCEASEHHENGLGFLAVLSLTLCGNNLSAMEGMAYEKDTFVRDVRGWNDVACLGWQCE